MRKVLLWLSVAVFLFASCGTTIRGNDRDFSAATKESPPAAEAKEAFIRSPDELVSEQIRARIEAAGVVTELRAGGEPVYTSDALVDFYERRLYRPAWSDKRGPTRLVDDLVSALRRADLEGLRPEDYHLSAIEILLAAMRVDIRILGVIVPDRWAELDLLLTDAFLVYGFHLLTGRVNPETLKPEWDSNRRIADLAVVLETTLASGNIDRTLATLAPPQQGYRRLREALMYHRAVAAQGGWPSILDEPTLKRGDHGPPVMALRERLRLGGDLRAMEREDTTEYFDEAIEQALKKFQRRYGLTADGVLGAETRAELNVSAERRVEQLVLNLERWRWLPKDLGRRHIIVNIAAFELEVVEDDGVVLAMRVVVGLPFHHTPVFSDTMRYLVFNPYWQVPRNIAVREMLPRIKSDSTYLERQKLHVFRGWDLETPEIDPATVDWSAVDTTHFPFRLCMEPGSANVLGRIKFMFPNKYSVYIHDTPARSLFQKTQRGFSHGCIRIQQPIELAEYLLRQDSRWNRSAILRELDEVVDYGVPLPEPIPIHLLYWTAWADEDGTIQFRRDIYDRDAPLLEAMRARPPASQRVVGVHNFMCPGGFCECITKGLGRL